MSMYCHIDSVVNNSNKPDLDIQMSFCGNFLLDAPSHTISEYSLSKRIEYSTNSYNSHTHTPTSQKLTLQYTYGHIWTQDPQGVILVDKKGSTRHTNFKENHYWVW